MSIRSESGPVPIGIDDCVRKALDVRVGYLGPRMRLVSYLRGFGGEGALVLNPVATKMYELVDGRRSVGQIAEQVAASFCARKDIVDRDTVTFMNDMLDRGFVERLPPTR